VELLPERRGASILTLGSVTPADSVSAATDVRCVCAVPENEVGDYELMLCQSATDSLCLDLEVVGDAGI